MKFQVYITYSFQAMFMTKKNNIYKGQLLKNMQEMAMVILHCNPPQ
jgi:hypothetical protein